MATTTNDTVRTGITSVWDRVQECAMRAKMGGSEDGACEECLTVMAHAVGMAQVNLLEGALQHQSCYDVLYGMFQDGVDPEEAYEYLSKILFELN